MSKSWEISRRTFLRGLGATIALPLLDAMAPSVARAAARGAATPPLRMAFCFVPNGAIKDVWTPGSEGPLHDLPQSLEPLESVKDELLVMTNLSQMQGQFNVAGDHARGTSCFLTGVRPQLSQGSDIHLGISVDQIAAQKVGNKTRLPSLELGTQSGNDAGSCDSGYSCAYSSNISWRTPTTPMAKEANPRLVFERLFGNGDQKQMKQSFAEREMTKKSILDYAMEDANQLRGKLGKKDQEKLDEYLYSVREVEKQASAMPIYSSDGRILSMKKPEGIPSDYADHVRLMCDLQVLAFQGDVTRITTFMFGLAGDNRGYRAIGVPEGHHDLSHHSGDQDKIAKLRKIDRYNVSLYAYFLERLRSVKEGNGTLLDHSMILFGSELGDGNAHSHDNLPLLLAGKANGTIKTGRHLKYGPDTPLCNLFLAMLDRMGADAVRMGDSTGKIKGLEG
jgi:hypothetical protein